MEFDKSKYFYIFSREGIAKALEYLSLTTPKHLFKFYSLGNEKDALKLQTLGEEKIWVDLFCNQNDPFEMVNFSVDESTVKDKFDKNGNKLISKEKLIELYQNNADRYRDTLKFAAFTQTMETNISMWAYYTNNHVGFCCDYEIINTSSSGMVNIKPIFYESNISKVSAKFMEHLLVDGLNALVADDKEMKLRSLTNFEVIKILGSCKDPSWAHEKEYRIFYLDDSGDKTGKSVSAKDLNVKLTAIYIGLNCSSENEQKLIEIANNLNVKVYKMKKSRDKYSLIPEEIINKNS